jgi:hypothetical protein
MLKVVATGTARRSAEEHVAAMGAAYELYVGRLRVLNALCCSRNCDAAQARAIADARLRVEEAYARWFMLARPDRLGAPPDKDKAARLNR